MEVCEAKSSSRPGSASIISTRHSDGSSSSLPDVENINREPPDEKDAEETVDDEQNEETELAGEKKKVLKKLTEEEVTARVEEIMPRLSCCEDFSTEQSTKDISFLKRHSGHSSNRARKIRYFDKLSELGVAMIFKKIWTTYFTDSFPDELPKEVWENMKCILLVIINGTDKSIHLCKEIIENDIHILIIKWLRDDKLAPEKSKSAKRSHTIKGFFGIIHNTLANTSVRSVYREAGMVDALKAFLEAPNLMIRTRTIILLSYLITEEEEHLINAEDNNLMLLVKILQSCLEKKDSLSRKYGFHANEVLEVFNLLGAIDSNKERIVNNGMLPIYTKLLKLPRTSEQREEEQVLAAEGVWTLAFNQKIRKQILEMPSLMTALTTLANEEDTPDSVKQAAKGALWVIESKDEEHRSSSPKAHSTRPNQASSAHDDRHIMISYNWGSKSIMLQVRDRLKAEGFNVWMDVDNMTGSTLEAMADAVEKSSLVLICMTQKYKESPSCRTEAEYTYKLRKTFVPVRLEYKYNPDGWLGIMIGTKLWFDFSVDEKFENSLHGLVKEIRLMMSDGGKGEQPLGKEPSSAPVAKPTAQPTSSSQAGDCSKEKVQEWIAQNELTDLGEKFKDFKGQDIVRLKKVLDTAPEFYYSSLRDHLKLSLLNILRFTDSLEKI